MKFELPVIRRCCGCFPLRPGLLVLGYTRLIFIILILAFLIKITVDLSNDTNHMNSLDTSTHYVVNSVLIVISIMDLCFTIVFVLGGHKKSPKLLRVFYIFIIIVCSCFTILFLASNLRLIIEHIDRMSQYKPEEQLLTMTWVLTLTTMVTVGYAGIQLYVILLIRSKIIQLNANKFCMAGSRPLYNNMENDEYIDQNDEALEETISEA